MIERFLASDWLLFVPALLISLFGLVTMMGFGEASLFAQKQMLWIMLASVCFFVFAQFDWRVLRQTRVALSIYFVAVFLLAILYLVGSVFNGAQGWINLGWFALQPADPAKFALIVIIAKYFSKRHTMIAHFQHILISALYALGIALLLVFQPDFGSAIIVLAVWGAMMLLTGIPLRYIAILGGVGVIALTLFWNFGFAEYQRARVLTFLNPLADIHGSGYNAYQSLIAVGSAGLFGKGVGYGTQSRLEFLPQHETDFIFASFVEEWGFVGAVMLLSLLLVIVIRLIDNARRGATNFESLFCLGVAMLILIHTFVHVGGNIGLLPVTGTTLPFMSYGGSHLLVLYSMLGIVSAMRSYERKLRFPDRTEIVGTL